MDLNTLTLSDARRLIAIGQLSPSELTRACLERIEVLNPKLNCFITLTPEHALEQALGLETRITRFQKSHHELPSLFGIPMALKDLMDVCGVRTTAGSLFFNDNVPESDATAVDKLRRAGAIFLGKLNLHEIALGVTNVNPHHGPCHNPWDPDRISGGSSGGSAAALAAGLCLGSLGTDSGGSIRIPSALCGIPGLKPTYGRVSTRGVIPLSWNTDHVGPMGRCVEDIALLLQAIAGYDPLDPASVRAPRHDYLGRIADGVWGWRIGLVVGEFFERTDNEVWNLIQAAAQVFSQLGAKVTPIDFPGLHQAARANMLIVTSDAAASYQERLRNHPELFGEDVLRRLRDGEACSSTEYALARRTQVSLHRQFEKQLKYYDLLLMPTTPITAPPIEGPDAVEQARLLTRYTAPFNLTGFPALSVPCGFSNLGLPVGLQVVGRPWSEARILRAAYAYEKASAWREVIPEMIRHFLQ